MAGTYREEMLEAARRMEERGQTTLSIKGRVFPTVTVAGLERMFAQAEENVRTGRVVGPGDEVWAVIRQAEYTGQETVTIDGREYPSATPEDIERLCVMAREREQADQDVSWGKEMVAPKLDPARFDRFGNPLSEEELRRLSDPDHWFNDLEDNRRWEEEDRQLTPDRCWEEAWEGARRTEKRGQTTYSINGWVVPAGRLADLERINPRAAERARNRPADYPGDKVREAIRQWEYTGQKTITIDGREYPAATPADIQRLDDMAREWDQAAARDASRESG